MLRIPSPKLIEPGTACPADRARRHRDARSGAGRRHRAVTGDVSAAGRSPRSSSRSTSTRSPRSIPDPVFRRQLVGAAVALGLTIHPPDPAVATRTRELAAALGVDEPLLGAFERASKATGTG